MPSKETKEAAVTAAKAAVEAYGPPTRVILRVIFILLVVIGLLWVISKITGIKKGSSFAFGVLYRVNDAVIPTFEMEKGNLLLGVSYDMNVSKLSQTSRLRGGIEMSLRLTNFSDFLYQNKAKG